ncbi:DUF2628 domain-containing protein [Cobetia sp. MMG027]|uniref:DUF2628 domain-containing protein n=1 Tax=Cobetia sp. MMG027 TaxID=3021980 RepID=UPI0022FE42D1|nr:DUF2628 domain-containing protein [Cobetia sp. MMG027]MDA5564208.1 DUF2628 domain-containing protein [Cobetia sp. MMG027]
MASFRILTHPEHGKRAVKIGWSWPAFFFGLFWALYKRMWLLAASLFGFIVLSSVFIPPTMDGQLISNILFLGLNLTISLKGNQWYASLLETQGFTREAQVEARNPNDALAVHANAHRSPADDSAAGSAHDDVQGQNARDDRSRDEDPADDDNNDDQSGGAGGQGGSKSSGGNTSGTFIG